jgi:hypothetical protein
MSLEIATTIQGLVATNPVVSDPESQGDDHIRMIKAVLKAIFPGVGGQGFAIPITATEAQLNFVTGATGNIQEQIQQHNVTLQAHQDAISSQGNSIITLNAQTASLQAQINAINPQDFAAGTFLIFFQQYAPFGWTRATYHDNKMVTIGDFTAGGTHDPRIMNVVPAHTHDNNFSLSVNPDGLHNHSVDYTCISAGGQVQSGTGANAIQGVFTRTSSFEGSHTHGLTITGGVTSNPGAAEWRPLYLAGILCRKD